MMILFLRDREIGVMHPSNHKLLKCSLNSGYNLLGYNRTPGIFLPSPYLCSYVGKLDGSIPFSDLNQLQNIFPSDMSGTNLSGKV